MRFHLPPGIVSAEDLETESSSEQRNLETWAQCVTRKEKLYGYHVSKDGTASEARGNHQGAHRCREQSRSRQNGGDVLQLPDQLRHSCHGRGWAARRRQRCPNNVGRHHSSLPRHPFRTWTTLSWR